MKTIHISHDCIWNCYKLQISVLSTELKTTFCHSSDFQNKGSAVSVMLIKLLPAAQLPVPSQNSRISNTEVPKSILTLQSHTQSQKDLSLSFSHAHTHIHIHTHTQTPTHTHTLKESLESSWSPNLQHTESCKPSGSEHSTLSSGVPQKSSEKSTHPRSSVKDAAAGRRGRQGPAERRV